MKFSSYEELRQNEQHQRDIPGGRGPVIPVPIQHMRHCCMRFNRYVLQEMSKDACRTVRRETTRGTNGCLCLIATASHVPRKECQPYEPMLTLNPKMVPFNQAIHTGMQSSHVLHVPMNAAALPR